MCALRLEVFTMPDAPLARTTVVMDVGALEDLRILAYEQGYTAGWDDAAAAQTDDQSRIKADFARNLQSLGFTFQEARMHVLRAIHPLIQEIVSHLLPKIARENLVTGAHTNGFFVYVFVNQTTTTTWASAERKLKTQETLKCLKEQKSRGGSKRQTLRKALSVSARAALKIQCNTLKTKVLHTVKIFRTPTNIGLPSPTRRVKAKTKSITLFQLSKTNIPSWW